MKKLFSSLVLVSILSVGSLNAAVSCSTTMDNVTISSYSTMSSGVLQQSTGLLELAQTLESTGSTTNTEYLNAMLQLSTDIGTMADRILIMADNIGIMSDRIVEVININSQNLALTQSNLLEATRIFTELLNVQ